MTENTHAATAIIAAPTSRRRWLSNDDAYGAPKPCLLSFVVDDRAGSGGKCAHGFVRVAVIYVVM